MQHLYLPPENLEASFTNPNVILTWDDPIGTYALTAFGIYRDGVLIDEWQNNLYIDSNLPSGTYTYYVTAIYGAHESVPSNEVTVEVTGTSGNIVATGDQLIGNYPNPFNPETQILFNISEPGDVSIEVYNIKGELIKTLEKENLSAGQNSIVWNGSDDTNKPASSGIYFYKMKAGKFIEARKMILMK
jgi:flagellar hook assembly protein FlgD